MSLKLISRLVALILFAAIGVQVFEWTFNRVYVPRGESLLVRYKGPPLPFLPGNRPPAKTGAFAEVDERGRPTEVGIVKEMLGPGRHFLMIGWWETTPVPDVIVKPGEVMVVTSKMGADLTSGQFLVDGDLSETGHKGVLRRVFGPGVYRLNPYAYDNKVIKQQAETQGTETKLSGWVQIHTGYVGVVTNTTDNPVTGAKAGTQNEVLPPGIYPMNPYEQKIDQVPIGFWEKTIKSNIVAGPDGTIKLDSSGEPMIIDDDAGITFPSNDGFRIHMDFTAVWGITAEQAPDVIRKFGNVEAVETKVVVPQIESICRLEGSRHGAVDLLVGESRQAFQTKVSDEFERVLDSKGLTLQHGFVRHIYIPQEVRLPIQQKYVADELKLTRDQEQITARTEASFRESEQKVMLESERIKVETEKLVAQAIAEGEREAAETEAETKKLVAAVDRETAELEAQATVLKGQAEAEARKLKAEAESSKFALAVEAFGSGMSYNQWVFANGLPDNVQIETLYAGEGTFWTDLKGFSEVMLGHQTQNQLRTDNRGTPAQPVKK